MIAFSIRFNIRKENRIYWSLKTIKFFPPINPYSSCNKTARKILNFALSSVGTFVTFHISILRHIWVSITAENRKQKKPREQGTKISEKTFCLMANDIEMNFVQMIKHESVLDNASCYWKTMIAEFLNCASFSLLNNFCKFNILTENF